MIYNEKFNQFFTHNQSIQVECSLNLYILRKLNYHFLHSLLCIFKRLAKVPNVLTKNQLLASPSGIQSFKSADPRSRNCVRNIESTQNTHKFIYSKVPYGKLIIKCINVIFVNNMKFQWFSQCTLAYIAILLVKIGQCNTTITMPAHFIKLTRRTRWKILHNNGCNIWCIVHARGLK